MLCMVLKYDNETHRTVGVNEDGSTTDDLNKVSLLPEDDAFALAARVGGGGSGLVSCHKLNIFSI